MVTIKKKTFKHCTPSKEDMILAFLRDLNARHTALKERIHAYRFPLPPGGQKFMGLVYFTIPVIAGYYVMQWAIGQSEKNLGPKGKRLEDSMDASSKHKAASMKVLIQARNKMKKDSDSSNVSSQS